MLSINEAGNNVGDPLKLHNRKLNEHMMVGPVKGEESQQHPTI